MPTSHVQPRALRSRARLMVGGPHVGFFLPRIRVIIPASPPAVGRRTQAASSTKPAQVYCRCALADGRPAPTLLERNGSVTAARILPQVWLLLPPSSHRSQGTLHCGSNAQHGQGFQTEIPLTATSPSFVSTNAPSAHATTGLFAVAMPMGGPHAALAEIRREGQA